MKRLSLHVEVSSAAVKSQSAVCAGFACRSAACSDWNDNITNMSQVAFREMEYHLFHRGLDH